MREEELRRYFVGEASVSQLAKDIDGSVVKIDDLQSEIPRAGTDETYPVKKGRGLMRSV